MKKFKIKKSKCKIIIQNSKFLLLICGFAFLLFTFVFNAYAQDKIVAVVNNEIVTQKDLNDFTNFMRMQLAREYAGKELQEKIESMKPDLLSRIIEDRLMLQQAKKAGIATDENRVKAKISEIKKRYPSEEEFQNDLALQGLVQGDLEAKIKEQFLMYAIMENKIRSRIIIRPEEITSFYNQNKAEFLAPEARELLVVILENQDQAKTFSYDLKTGHKPEELAAIFPVTIDKMTVVKGRELKKEIEEVIFKLGITEVTDPIKTDDKYYVFRLENIIPPRQQNLAEAQERINGFLFDQKTKDELTKWLDELKKQSYIKIY